MKENKVKRFLIITLFMMVCSLFSSNASLYRPDLTDIVTTNLSSTSILEIQSKKILVDEVQQYIDRISPKSNLLIANYIVDYSLEYNLDICFVLAQTQIETHFGALGVGRSTSRYSLFGVCKSYTNYDNAVKDYCRLVRTSYLGTVKTENDLMKKYVTLSGKRYASNRKYEVSLRKLYKKIKNTTKIYELQKGLKN